MNIQELGHNLIDMLQISRQSKPEKEDKNSVFAQLLACLTGPQDSAENDLVSGLIKSKADVVKEKNDLPSLPRADGKKASRVAIDDKNDVKKDAKNNTSHAEYNDKKEAVAPERQSGGAVEQNSNDAAKESVTPPEAIVDTTINQGFDIMVPVEDAGAVENMAVSASVPEAAAADMAVVQSVGIPELAVAETNVSVLNNNEAIPVNIDVEDTVVAEVGNMSEIDGKSLAVQTEKAEVVVENITADEVGVSEEILPVVAGQEEKIAAMVQAPGKKLEISVNIKQDKVEAAVTQDLVQNLDDAVKAVDKTVSESSVQIEANVADADISMQPKPIAAVVEMPQAVMPSNVSIAEENVKALGAVSVSSVDMSALKPSTVIEKNNAASLNIYKGLSREVAEKIQVNITQSAIKGVDEIEIQLKPETLGKLDIKLHIGKDGKLQAHIVASNEQALEVLRRDVNILEDAFGKAGYQLDDNSLSFSYRGDSDHNGSERERLRTFIGEVIEQDLAMETAANDYIGSDGVNIRV